jgi:hypothetical protein
MDNDRYQHQRQEVEMMLQKGSPALGIQGVDAGDKAQTARRFFPVSVACDAGQLGGIVEWPMTSRLGGVEDPLCQLEDGKCSVPKGTQ